MPRAKSLPARVSGDKLRVGDVIEVWWQPNRDAITSLKPYTGPLTCFEPEGASLATFALNTGGMTIEHGGLYRLLGRSGANA